MAFLAKALEKPLFKAFMETKQVDKLVDIMAYQYSKANAPNTKFIRPEIVDNDFQGSFLVRVFKEFYGKKNELLEQVFYYFKFVILKIKKPLFKK